MHDAHSLIHIVRNAVLYKLYGIYKMYHFSWTTAKYSVILAHGFNISIHIQLGYLMGIRLDQVGNPCILALHYTQQGNSFTNLSKNTRCVPHQYFMTFFFWLYKIKIVVKVGGGWLATSFMLPAGSALRTYTDSSNKGVDMKCELSMTFLASVQGSGL